MSKRSIRRKAEVLAVLGLLALVAACSRAANEVSYTTPGWYLEKPRFIAAMGPQIFGGPFGYDECEARRKALPPVTAEQMLCIQEFTKPGRYGPY